MSAMLCGQLLEGLQGIWDKDITVVARGNHGGVIDYSDSATILQRLCGKAVAVEGIAPQGEEDAARRTATAVCGHLGVGEEQVVWNPSP
jgi:hypothetical protein